MMEQIDVLDIIQELIDKTKHEACTLCAFEDKESWEEPCKFCQRNCRDYWRYKANIERGE